MIDLLLLTILKSIQRADVGPEREIAIAKLSDHHSTSIRLSKQNKGCVSIISEEFSAGEAGVIWLRNVVNYMTSYSR